MEVKTYKGSDLKVAAKLALKHRLFVNTWTLNGDLHATLKSTDEVNEDCQIALVFKDGKPVCIAFTDNFGYGIDLQVFCKKSERRKGYGTIAAQQLIKSEDHWVWNPGVNGSCKFFNKLERTQCKKNSLKSLMLN